MYTCHGHMYTCPTIDMCVMFYMCFQMRKLSKDLFEPLINSRIHIYFLRSVHPWFTTLKWWNHWTYGLHIWHANWFPLWKTDFWQIKVKGQGKIKTHNMCLFWANFGHIGYVWGHMGPMRVRQGTFGSVPTKFGILPNVVGQQGASSSRQSFSKVCARFYTEMEPSGGTCVVGFVHGSSSPEVFGS